MLGVEALDLLDAGAGFLGEIEDVDLAEAWIRPAQGLPIAVRGEPNSPPRKYLITSSFRSRCHSRRRRHQWQPTL